MKKPRVEVQPLEPADLPAFKRDMQEAFQRGAEEEFGPCPEILPESHIDRSLAAEGAAAYKAVLEGELVGGAVVVVPADGGTCHLDFLYVKHGVQGRGVGQALWNAIEARYPQAELWETHTPYFEKRNIHFYVNRCGFHIVEFFSPIHPDAHMAGDDADSPECAPHEMPGGDYFFRFEKRRPGR